MRSLREVEKLLWRLTEKAVDVWFTEQMKNPHAAYYLYYLPEGDMIIIATDKPEGYMIGSTQRISPAWTKEQACYRVHDMLKSLPLLNPTI